MITYRMAKPEEYKKFTSFANRIFGLDFETLLPKIYHPDGNAHEMTMLAEENGILVAEAAMVPQELHIGNVTIHATFLGTVCVDPAFRGRGYMKGMMETCLKKMEETSDISVLGGQRQRYEYFGYTPGGILCEYQLCKANIYHGLNKVSTESLRLIPLFDYPDAEQQTIMKNTKKPAYITRQEKELRRIAASYYEEPFAITIKGKMAGYLLTSKDRKRISEIEVDCASMLLPVIKSYFETFQIDTCSICLPEYETEKNSLLIRIAEQYTIKNTDMFRIFCFSKIVRAYLNLKAETIGISDGRFSAVMDGQPLTISVKNNIVSVTEETSENALQLNRRDAQELLLLPFYPKKYPSLPQDWFPLPLFWYLADCS